jgi:Zn-dependent M16 (insulinase) family peptidase
MSDITFNDQSLASKQEKEFGWITGSQVCFCAEAFPTVNSSHPDAPILSVLATVLRNGYLHSAIREKGGAYGAGASHDSKAQVFLFYSYRDPKCKETFIEFSNSRKWALKNISSAQLEEGILGVISSIDKPMSPAGEAGSDFLNLIQGKSQDERLEFRARVKECTLSDLKKMATKYFDGDSKRAVLAGEGFQNILEDEGFEIKVI